MSKQSASNGYAEAFDTISRFLAEPPKDMPNELLNAFNLLGGNRFLSPRLFFETVEQAPVAISITDPTARILYANSAFEKLTGYPRDEVIGKNESMLSSKSTPAEVYQDLWQSIVAGKVWGGTLVNIRQDGQEYLAKLSISPVLNEEGRIAYFLGMHDDVTEIHALERRLSFQKTLTETTLNAAPMVVVVIDSDGTVLLENHAYKTLISDLGDDPARLFVEALHSQIGLDLPRVCHSGDGFTNVEVRLDATGTLAPRWFACSGVRINNLDEAARSYFNNRKEDGCCLLLLANEITESRNRINEARLNMIRANMAEQQMVQTMREAINASLFKLQAPLNIIRAAMNMSANGGSCAGMGPVLQQALETGEEAVESLHGSLPGPRIEPAALVNVNELLHEVLRLSTDSFLSAGIVIDWQASPVLGSINARPNALRGLFKYIIDNAIHSLKESGRDYREIRLETREEQGELLISIMDNGRGIAQNERLKVFEPFYCGWSRPREHAGMGLTMAQEVAIGHRGSIEIDQHFIGGCRVFVRLPVHGMGGEVP
ncbi:MAG: nitrogen fixation negative regulator NifL [Gammaproteobacteria bacterium]|nr:nitrogen fixation negative regulator NifL [Gammaproteobacteria bacterium]